MFELSRSSSASGARRSIPPSIVLASSLLLLAALPAFAALPTRAPAAAAGPCRPQTPSRPISNGAVTWQVSPCSGGIESIKLHDPQFELRTAPPHDEVPTWARAKFAPGPLELVGSWRAKWDPFHELLAAPGYKDVLVEVRAKPGSAPSEHRYADLSALRAAYPRFEIVESAGSGNNPEIVLVWPDPTRIKSPVYFVRRFVPVAAKKHALATSTEVWNLGQRPISFRVRHIVTAYGNPKAGSGGLFAMLAGRPDLKSGGFHVGDETVHMDTHKLAKADPEERARGGRPDWLGTDSRYFALVTVPGKGWGKNSAVHMVSLGNGVIEVVLQGEGEALAAAAKDACVPAWYAVSWGGTACATDFERLGIDKPVAEEIAEPFIEAARRRGQADPRATEAAIARIRGRRVKLLTAQLYTGPKRIEALRRSQETLDEIINYGWFGAIARPLVWILKMAHRLTGNWPIAIIILTVLVKVLLWPIMGKSMKSMRKMSALKPELDRIKERLAEEARRQGLDKPDANKLNQETFALYKRHGVNPLGGCLPMFIQMPVYIALYRSIYSSVELYNQPLFGWVTDLTQKDPYYVLPVVLGAAMFVQSRLQPQAGGDDTQRKMMLYFMPIMFTVMMASLPSGLVLYILVNTVLSSVQTLWLARQDAKA